MTIVVEKLHDKFAARIRGVDLTKPLPVDVRKDIQAALDRYAVLVFPGAPLTEDQQADFAENFGQLERSNIIMKVKARIGGRLADISNIDENEQVFGEYDRRRMFSLGNQLWHTDSSFKKIPAKYSMLHAHVVTPEGGETQVVDTRVAYEALPQKMKDRIDGLVAEHSIFTSRAKLGFTDFTDEERASLPPVARPLVRSHKESGRKALYLASHISHICDMNVPDGKMLVRELLEHATQKEFIYELKWRVGDLMIWDNRCTLHRGRPYDDTLHRRDLRRATLEDLEYAAAEEAA
ncbi:MAG: TauD/TfdA family dioxygenase [Paracoccaceae bacterium]|jgi:alpha-ketoglutarate-dependent 2,4-dichlorophenoxyacetate dioxygenase|nr:TauD/TfdA family dioxygenase [Paracoccaceae bacterium]